MLQSRSLSESGSMAELRISELSGSVFSMLPGPHHKPASTAGGDKGHSSGHLTTAHLAARLTVTKGQYRNRMAFARLWVKYEVVAFLFLPPHRISTKDRELLSLSPMAL